MSVQHFDMAVIGSGPAGQKAAVQGAKAGKRVLVIEREQGVGGGCVYRGTIPSKTLRESALQMNRARRLSSMLEMKMHSDLPLAALMSRVDDVVAAHGVYMRDQLSRNGISCFHGRARFQSDRQIELQSVDGERQTIEADIIILATGSRPRTPSDIPIDHEHILDSDSILSMIYLPRTMTVLGGGIIASEYGSIFSQLGVKVTIIDRADRPLQFLDEELAHTFVQSFEEQGGRYLGGQRVSNVRWDGISQVLTTLQNGEIIGGEKMLVALGRQANIEDLGLEGAGLSVTEKGTIPVNDHCQTIVPHIYGVGDVIGPPGLASTAMEQGRRAACHALGLPESDSAQIIPMGIYTIPEMSSIGLDESGARKRYRSILVGRSKYHEIARGQISGTSDGLLKMIADPTGEYLLGVQIIGEGATELIHVGQMALRSGATIDSFIDNIFNFPTLAEAYRVAALDILGQRRKQPAFSAQSVPTAA
ncbi:putative soluble pyridine nucleotide transhydrogenase [Nitrospira sp. KM1]|uniref:Si-specific NAD(P)(+) transhydrogenase n=1 Tax=Nitrospira sp. KM1 TaxID=1936990 RepID=UPI0013A73632|nr:Si-specific NAD(P)(+) transhydrogenase [Nitrospira sp. KM1]BCA54830.1 putative soluble pyridine nucleotide transhydrogenase [Nitrospira sp. KM1]